MKHWLTSLTLWFASDPRRLRIALTVLLLMLLLLPAGVAFAGHDAGGG